MHSPYAVVDVYVGQLVRIKGAGFTPGDTVTLTICEDDTLLQLMEMDWIAYLLVDLPGDVVIANDCGAFEVYTYIPSIYASYWPPRTVTVRAWVGGVLQCVWPLDIWPWEEYWMFHPYPEW